MENNYNKKSYKPLIVILIIAFVLIVFVVSFLLIYPIVLSNNQTQATQPTPTQEERFVTDIEFKYFDEPSAFVEYIEEYTNFDFPDNYYTDHFLGICDNGGAVPLKKHDMICKYTCTVFLDNLPEDELAEFEKQISEDERFVEHLGDLKILIGSSSSLHEYTMVYNMDTKEYNTMPDRAGEYSLITISYDTDNHYFVVNRLNNKYWKLERNAQK